MVRTVGGLVLFTVVCVTIASVVILTMVDCDNAVVQITHSEYYHTVLHFTKVLATLVKITTAQCKNTSVRCTMVGG